MKNSLEVDDQQSEIDSTVSFVQQLIKSYQKTCLDFNIPFDYVDSLLFMKSKLISATLYHSSSREFLLAIYSDPKNILSVFNTDYPVQYYLTKRPELNFVEDSVLKSIIEEYDRDGGFMSTFTGPGFNTMWITESFSFPTTYIHNTSKYLSPRDSVLYCLTSNNLVSIKNDTLSFLRGLGILGKSTSIKGWHFAADRIGAEMATQELKHYFFNSENFRKLLGEKKISDYAVKKILLWGSHESNQPEPSFTNEYRSLKLNRKQQIDSFIIMHLDDFLRFNSEKILSTNK